MEGLFWLIAIFFFAYVLLNTFVYKKTKYYKENQLVSLMAEEKKLLTENKSSLDELESFLDKILTRNEQAKFTESLDEKSEEEISKMMKQLMLTKDSNFTDSATAKRALIVIYQFERAKHKYIRLMERLKHSSIDDQIKATQDWVDYTKLFFDPKTIERFSQTLVVMEEIEKRFDEQLGR